MDETALTESARKKRDNRWVSHKRKLVTARTIAKHEFEF